MGKRLENKNIVVTAAGQGIGRATAIAFNNEGANVYATDINETTLKSLNKEYQNIKVKRLDSTDNSAVEEALFLTKFARKVYLIHRREIFRASQIMLDRAKANPKIEFILNTEIKKINNPGENKVTNAILHNKKTSETTELDTDAVFIAIGHIPNTDIFKNQISLDDSNYIVCDEQHPKFSTQTDIEGVFAAGDVSDPIYRQAVTSAGSGCMAALDAEKYLDALK